MASTAASTSSVAMTAADSDVLAHALASSSTAKSQVTSSAASDAMAGLDTPRQLPSRASESGSLSSRSVQSDGSATDEASAESSGLTTPIGPMPGPLAFGQDMYRGAIFNSVKFGIADNFYTPFRCFIGGDATGGSFTWRHQGPSPMNYVETSAAINYSNYPINVVSWGVGGDDPAMPDNVYSRGSNNHMVYLSFTNRPGEFTLWGMSAASAQDLGWRYDNWLISGALNHGAHGSFIIWDITGITRKAHPYIAGDWCMGTAWCPDPTQREVIVCSLDGHIWVLVSPNTQYDFVVRYDIDAMAGPLWKCKYHPSGDYIYACSATGDIVCYWIRTAKPPPFQPWPPVVEIYRHNVGPVAIFDMSLVEVNGRVRIALATTTGLMVFDEDTMSVIANIEVPGTFPGTLAICRSVCWNYDGTEIVSGWGDFHIRLYTHGPWPPLIADAEASASASASASAAGKSAKGVSARAAQADSDPLHLVD